jgi:hypothetical protein
LPNFELLEIAALWQPPISPLQSDLVEAIRERGLELWPHSAKTT